MKFLSLVSVASLVASVVAQTFMINTPINPVVCEPVLLSWTGGTPPYFLSILPGGQPSAPALQDLGEQTGTSYTWQCTVSPGTSLGLTLRDSTGAIAQSGTFNVQNGPSTSCVNSTSSASSGASSTTGGSTASTGSSTSTTPGSSSTKSSSSSSGAPASTSSTSSSASIHGMEVSAVGFVAALVAAILA